MIRLVEGDFQSTKPVEELEALLGGESAISVSSTQLAIQMCLEVLGSRTHMIPCILPVNAPLDTMAAVLRAGAQPILLDINGGTLQMDAEQLQEALTEVEASVVLLTRPGGQPVSEELLELVQDQPTIIDTRLPPRPEFDTEIDLCGTFNVFDLTQVCGSGAVIKHKFAKQQKLLRKIRSGVMGHSAQLPALLAVRACKVIRNADKRLAWYRSDVERLRSELNRYADRGIIPWPASPSGRTPLLVFVPNARRAITQLRSHNIEAALGSYPLHDLTELRQRYKEEPSYPVAEQVMNQVIALPVVLEGAGHIAKIVGELSYD